MPGPTGLGIIGRNAGVPLNSGLILSNRWAPPQWSCPMSVPSIVRLLRVNPLLLPAQQTPAGKGSPGGRGAFRPCNVLARFLLSLGNADSHSLQVCDPGLLPETLCGRQGQESCTRRLHAQVADHTQLHGEVRSTLGSSNDYTLTYKSVALSPPPTPAGGRRSARHGQRHGIREETTVHGLRHDRVLMDRPRDRPRALAATRRLGHGQGPIPVPVPTKQLSSPATPESQLQKSRAEHCQRRPMRSSHRADFDQPRGARRLRRSPYQADSKAV